MTNDRMLDEYRVDDWIDITGLTVLRCTFDGCVVECRKEGERPYAVLDGCRFVDCRLVGDAWLEAIL